MSLAGARRICAPPLRGCLIYRDWGKQSDTGGT